MIMSFSKISLITIVLIKGKFGYYYPVTFFDFFYSFLLKMRQMIMNDIITDNIIAERISDTSNHFLSQRIILSIQDQASISLILQLAVISPLHQGH